MARIPMLSVVVPTRNESGNITPLTDRLTAALQGVEWELCFVDDSDDDTGTRIEAVAASQPGRIRFLLRHGAERVGGLSTAVVAGLRLARGEYVCVMDGDLQHPPETVPALLAGAQSGSDLVVASRYTADGASTGLDGGTRRLVSRSATGLARLLFWEARRSSDPLAGFFLCRRSLINGIEFRPVGFKILLELLVCLPQAKVTDVPMQFQSRQAGTSKASMRQGGLFLRHVWSLFTQVEGSARSWKFALVGISGLLVFLPCLAALAGWGHLPALLAFVPAFAMSLAWNTVFNRVFTYADQRRRTLGEGPGRYLERALASGAVMFAVYAVLIAVHVELLAAGAISAIIAMVINGLTNRAQVRLQPVIWTRVAADEGVRASLARLAEQLGADRAYALPAQMRGIAPATVPREVLARVVSTRRPTLWTESASHRPQRRTNIEVSSLMLVPVVAEGDDDVLAVLICERSATRGFDDAALDTATRAVATLAPVIAAALAFGDGAGAWSRSPNRRPPVTTGPPQSD